MLKNKVSKAVMGLFLSFALLVFGPLNALATGSTGIVLSNQAVTLNMGTLKTLRAIITPSNATDRNVTWKTSDPSIVTVNPYGSIYPVSLGTATITATPTMVDSRQRVLLLYKLA